MCGIVAYVGKKNAQSLLLEGLKRLEYRGYDSAGICIAHEGQLFVRRAVGRISVLESALENRASAIPAGSNELPYNSVTICGASSEIPIAAGSPNSNIHSMLRRTQLRTDCLVYFLRLLRGRGVPGADRPPRFIRNGELAQFRNAAMSAMVWAKVVL